MDALRAFMELRGFGARGPRYQVRMNKPDGMIIVESTREPLFAAARVLLARGITGKLELWDFTRSFCRMQGDIERLARLTVAEDKNGIGLRKYVERVTDGDSESEACDTPEIQTGRSRRAAQASRALGREAA
ncbi:hypothetical protein G5V57_14365 [Nordella sp. HKS 07]|uniref:hypothetical protein n=1 Tax=Nordella sp. HKS 07 TaxID=2712222 RepID=UPI0013E1CDC1|nr:hypothetical protein [Nordella sp. HKS 07]QIG48807.1 hypothetical protein G5V57_14365 [Nordella sp. HKS 07]